MRAFERKNIRLPADRYVGQNLYFVTLCFNARRRFGSNRRIASWLIDVLRRHAATSEFLVHAYCVMPDHMHLLTACSTPEGDLTQFIELFKQRTAHHFEQRTHQRLWQFKYYDRILRGTDSADRVAWYIWLNPLRKGPAAPRSIIHSLVHSRSWEQNS